MVACSRVACQSGVRPGMPLAEAVTLAQRRGQPLVQAHDAAADLAELARLAELCERFSPLVGWETTAGQPRGKQSAQPESTGPDVLFLDATGIGQLFGDEAGLLAAVQAAFAQQGYTTVAAIADTVAAAWGLANHASLSHLPQVATAAEDFGSLPIAALRLPAETLALLAQLGVQTIGQVQALPRTGLRARFGEQLLQRLDQLSGAAQETIVAHRPPPQFEAEWVLEYPARQRAVVEQIARELLERVALALAERGEGVVQLACRLDCEGGLLQLQVGLFRPTAEPRHLWDLVRMQLEGARLPGPVGRIGVRAVVTSKLANRQGELFAGGSRPSLDEIGVLIDRLSSRLGPAAIVRPQLRADPLPERAFRYASLVGSAPKKPRAENSSAAKSFPAGTRPLHLYQPPPVLEVLSVAPDGPPVSFRFEGHTQRIVVACGPERIEAGWWRTRSQRRDYYRVETTTGQRYWLFRDLATSTWHLHGTFG